MPAGKLKILSIIEYSSIIDYLIFLYPLIDHHFYFAKLKIGSIALLDAFGGPKYIDVKQYLAASNKSVSIDEINQVSRHAYQV